MPKKKTKVFTDNGVDITLTVGHGPSENKCIGLIGSVFFDRNDNRGVSVEVVGVASIIGTDIVPVSPNPKIMVAYMVRVSSDPYSKNNNLPPEIDWIVTDGLKFVKPMAQQQYSRSDKIEKYGDLINIKERFPWRAKDEIDNKIREYVDGGLKDVDEKLFTAPDLASGWTTSQWSVVNNPIVK